MGTPRQNPPPGLTKWCRRKRGVSCTRRCSYFAAILRCGCNRRDPPAADPSQHGARDGKQKLQQSKSNIPPHVQNPATSKRPYAHPAGPLGGRRSLSLSDLGQRARPQNPEPDHRPRPKKVDLGIDIWLSGCASWKRLAEAETAAKLFSSVSRLPELCDLAETGLDFFLFYVFGGVHALPVWLPIHCTIFPALQPVIRPPYYYILFTSSSVHPAQKRSPRELAPLALPSRLGRPACRSR